jgi:hypothetical protein
MDVTPTAGPQKELIRPLVDAPADDTADKEYFPGAVREEIGTVALRDVLETSFDVSQGPEWEWLKREADFDNPATSAFVLGLEYREGRSPAPNWLVPVLAEAYRKNLLYLIFAK